MAACVRNLAPWLVAVLFCSLFKETEAVESLRFLIIGDMGGVDYEPYSTYYERCTAREMGRLADLYAPQYVLELGDNFYYSGVKTVHDIRFNKSYEEVYTASSLQVPWYILAGNHDHFGNVSAQIEYSRLSQRWNFPDYYYYKEFQMSDFSVGFMMLDTVQLCGMLDDRVSGQPAGPEDVDTAEEQWRYAEKIFQTSTADYLFPAGHYPIYSIALGGPTKCLVDRLQPMVDKYGLNGYMAGHEHDLQHLRVKSSSGSNMDYFISGMANFVKFSMAHKDAVPPGSSQFYNGNSLSRGGFLYAETTAQNMTLTFINGLGDRLYSTVVFPRSKKP